MYSRQSGRQEMAIPSVKEIMAASPVLSLVAPQTLAGWRVAPNMSGVADTVTAVADSSMGVVLRIASLASLGALVYHGYKRNDSVGWALCWGLLGGIVWPITVPIAFAQGYAKPKKK